MRHVLLWSRALSPRMSDIRQEIRKKRAEINDPNDQEEKVFGRTEMLWTGE